MTKGQKNKTLIIGMVTYAIGTFGTKILSFFIVPLYTYYIAPEDLGDYDILVSTVALLSPLMTMKISEATYRWIIDNKENEIPYISATYTFMFRNCVLVALLIACINFFHPIWNCYYFIAILVCDRILECLQRLLRGLKNQKLFAVSGIFLTTVFVFLNLFKICYLKEGVSALLQSNLTSLVLTIVLILLFEPRLRKVRLKENYHFKHIEMLKYSAPLVPTALGWWMMNVSDRYLIRCFIGRAATGIYSVAYKFPSALSAVFNIFNNAWTDMALSEMNQKDGEDHSYAKELFKLLYKVSFGVALILIPSTMLLMELVLSATYKESSKYIGFLYLATVFQGLSTFCGISYLKEKKTFGAAKTSLVGAIVNVVIHFICIHYIGLFAASVSTFVGFVVMWAWRMRDIKNVLPIQVEWGNFLFYVCAGVCMAIITIWTTIQQDIMLTALATVWFITSNRQFLMQTIRKACRRIKNHDFSV